MPSFTFKGFATGSPVAISAAQGASSDGGSVTAWGQGGAGVINVSAILPPRIVAPAGVWLDATAVSGFNVAGPSNGDVYDPRYHEITHIWDTGDTGTWSAPENMPPAWNNKAVAYGPRVCHTFGTPGIYTPSVWGADTSGNSGGGDATAFTVLDPDDVYTGTDTICIALDASFAGAPAGCTQVTSIAALQSAINNSSGPTRVLFKRGEMYSDVYLNCRNDEVEYIGAWGSGARPVLYGQKYVNAPNKWMFNYTTNDGIEQITITGLDLRSHWRADGEVGYAGTPWWVWNIRRDNVHMTIHDCSFDGFDQVDLDIGAEQSRPGAIVMSDCFVTNWASYGCFSRRNSNQANFRVGWVGCRITQDVNALHGTNYQLNELVGNDHGPIRFEAIGQHYIGASDLFSNTGWSPLGPDQGVQPCVRINTYADDARGFSGNVERCVMEGGFHTINMSGENPGRVEHPGNYLFDKLVMIGSAKTAAAGGSGNFFHLSFGGTTIRNVLGVLPDVPHYHDTGNDSEHCISFAQDNSASGNADQPVAVYNCTFINLRTPANDPSFNWTATVNEINFTNLAVENNIVHAPGIDTPVNADGPLASDDLAGITLRYKGVLFGTLIKGTTGSVADDEFFSVAYPSGTDQAFWQGIEATDTLHLMWLSEAELAADNGDFDVDFTQSNEIRIYNRTGGTWSGAYEIRLDRKSAYTFPTTYANPATIPLPRPDTGSNAIDGGDTGRKAYDDLMGSVRPPSGNERGALLR